jgi:hypothetical protein
LDPVGLLEKAFARNELINRQIVDFKDDLLILDVGDIRRSFNDQDGVPARIIDDALGFLGRPAPLLEGRVLIDLEVVPAALVDDLGRADRRRNDFELLDQDLAGGIAAPVEGIDQADGETECLLALELGIEFIDEFGDEDPPGDGVGLVRFPGGRGRRRSVIVLENEIVVVPEMNEDVVVPAEFLEILAGLPRVCDLGDQVVRQGRLGENDVEGNALDRGLLLAAGQDQDRRQGEYPKN